MAENWWRIDYASSNTVPYLYRFTALVNILVLFRKIWCEKVGEERTNRLHKYRCLFTIG